MDLCRRLDPTRQWVSADGDDDGGGKLPTFVIHYGDEGTMKRAAQSGKPWGVGEASSAYYSTPEQVAKNYGERAYESFRGRMEGLRSKPMPISSTRESMAPVTGASSMSPGTACSRCRLGLPDTSKPPTLDGGVFFPSLVEDKPGRPA